MNEKEFDLDFDFEKEYGFDTPEADAAGAVDEDFDLRSILESDFDEDPDLLHSEYTADFDYGPELEEEPVLPEAEEEPVPADYEPVLEEPLELPVEEEVPVEEPPAEEEQAVPGSGRRRKPMSPMRKFKNEQLPLIIMAAAAVLILFFIVGSASRAIGNHLSNKEQELNASEQAQDQEQLEQLQVARLLSEAADLAAGYDYDAAISALESFSGDKAKYPDIDTRLSQYRMQKSTLVKHTDPSAVANLSFNLLIADPSRAFTNQELGGKYNMNFVTTDEFELILQQLYDNGYVLVSMDDVVVETINGDKVVYSAGTIELPDGKKPIMITETLCNYLNYMIDSDNDGVADKNGAGFASRLVVTSAGEIKAEMVNSAGETVQGNYDLVPILEDFIAAHPDFSYRGARATIAVTGYEGVFGYRINSSVKESKGQEYYDQQVAGAKAVANALREKGYEIACNTYGYVEYDDSSTNAISEDLAKWNAEIVPVIGTVDTIVFTRDSDIGAAGSYSGPKYNLLRDAGFRYFLGSGSKTSASVYDTYVRQNRLLVSGTQMAHASSIYTAYFDAKVILNSQRGNVPQA